MTPPTKAKQPLDDAIIQQCRKLIIANFQSKGDSWLTMERTEAINFLIAKLTEEFAECIQVLKAVCDEYDADIARKELADLINVASMLHKRLRP